MLKISNVRMNGGKKGFIFLSAEKAFTFGLFFRYVGDVFSRCSMLAIGVYTDFKACNKKSFFQGIIHMSMTDIFAFNIFKSSTMF
jgi:hypothetical protein